MRDDLIGFLFLGVMAFFAIMGKVLEKRKAAQGKRGGSTLRPEDLPDATRRILYGPSGKPAEGRQAVEPRMARPRQAQPGIPTAVPRTAVPQTDAPQRPVQRPTPRPAPMAERQAPQAPARRMATPPPRRAPAAGPRPRPAQRRMPTGGMASEQSLREARRQEYPAKHRAPRQVQTAPRQKHRHEIRAEKLAASRPRPKPAEKAPRPAATWSTMGIRELLRRPETIRQGIILREVLGPPKGLENIL